MMVTHDPPLVARTVRATDVVVSGGIAVIYPYEIFGGWIREPGGF